MEPKAIEAVLTVKPKRVDPEAEERRKRIKMRYKIIKNNKPKEDVIPVKKKQKEKNKELTYKEFYDIAGVKQHAQFEKYLNDIIFKPEERKKFYDAILELNHDLSQDIFKPYFELYSAERKSFQQDYTPQAVANLISRIARTDPSPDWAGYDATAGTGGLIIAKWDDDRNQESPWSYAPHRYLYRADELADNVLPYLIHNLAMRGMNCIVVHGDALTRKAKQIYFIQNSQDDFMAYSDVNVMPHTEDVANHFGISEWEEEAIEHIESEKVVCRPALPMQKRKLEVNTNRPKYRTVRPWMDAPKLKEVAFVERAKKGKIYPKDSMVIQISATNGQTGMLTSDGEVDTKYAVITLHYWFLEQCNPDYFFLWLKRFIPNWLRRVQEGMNVKLEDIEKIPLIIPVVGLESFKEEIEYGQLSLF